VNPDGLGSIDMVRFGSDGSMYGVVHSIYSKWIKSAPFICRVTSTNATHYLCDDIVMASLPLGSDVATGAFEVDWNTHNAWLISHSMSGTGSIYSFNLFSHTVRRRCATTRITNITPTTSSTNTVIYHRSILLLSCYCLNH
jgi:hypothetical protein